MMVAVIFAQLEEINEQEVDQGGPNCAIQFNNRIFIKG
jgi:hypothetical protein